MKVELTDAQWVRIAKLLPKPKAKPKSGRPPGYSSRSAPFACQSRRVAARPEETLAQVAVPRPGAGRPKQKPQRIIADRGYDCRPLWERVKRRGIQLIVPHLSTRRHRYQDGRCLRRYKRRWIIERTNG